MKRSAPAAYSLSILLPDTVERELRAWIERTPGATLPSWGAHVTLLGDFVPTDGLARVQDAVAQVCAASRPFSARFDRIIAEPHWKRPHLQAVLLANRPRSTDRRRLVEFHRKLSTALEPFKRDLFPNVSQRPFNPHTSLTWGLPDGEAAQLARAARAAHLSVEFTVDRIWLLQIAPTPQRCPHARTVPCSNPRGAGEASVPVHPAQPSLFSSRDRSTAAVEN